METIDTSFCLHDWICKITIIFKGYLKIAAIERKNRDSVWLSWVVNIPLFSTFKPVYVHINDHYIDLRLRFNDIFKVVFFFALRDTIYPIDPYLKMDFNRCISFRLNTLCNSSVIFFDSSVINKGYQLLLFYLLYKQNYVLTVIKTWYFSFSVKIITSKFFFSIIPRKSPINPASSTIAL